MQGVLEPQSRVVAQLGMLAEHMRAVCYTQAFVGWHCSCYKCVSIEVVQASCLSLSSLNLSSACVFFVCCAAQELQLTPDSGAFAVLRVAIRDEEEEDVTAHFTLVSGMLLQDQGCWDLVRLYRPSLRLVRCLCLRPCL